jgi:hypothetical protein
LANPRRENDRAFSGSIWLSAVIRLSFDQFSLLAAIGKFDTKRKG